MVKATIAHRKLTGDEHAAVEDACHGYKDYLQKYLRIQFEEQDKFAS